MNFMVNNGPFIKDKNNVQKITLINLITLIPFLIYRCFLNGINSITLFIVSIIATLFTTIMFDYVTDKKINFKNYYKDLIFSIILVIITPINTPYLLIFFVSVLVILLSKFFDKINIYIIAAFIIYSFLKLNNNNFIFSNYNIYIFSLLLIFSIITLILNRSIKFRISLFCILFLILKIVFNNEILNIDYILLFSCIYIIPEFKSTPNTAFIQIVFGLVIGVISIFLNIEYIFISVMLLNILFKFFDQNYSYYLAKI